MKIFELFETVPPLAAVIPGAEIGEIPAGGRTSGDAPTTVTQAGPTTTNTPKTPQPTGFTPGSKVVTPQPGSSAITAKAGQTVPGQTSVPNQNQPSQQSGNNSENTMVDMTNKIASLQATVNMMKGRLTPPPEPLN